MPKDCKSIIYCVFINLDNVINRGMFDKFEKESWIKKHHNENQKMKEERDQMKKNQKELLSKSWRIAKLNSKIKRDLIYAFTQIEVEE